MPFDELDKKIIEAADHHHPDYDEQAWEKMRKKLDKHLPEKKDDRRRLLFLLLGLLFLGAGTFFIFNNRIGNGSKKNTLNITASEKQVRDNTVSTSTQKNELPEILSGKTSRDVIRAEKTPIDKNSDEATNTTVYDKQLKKETEKNKLIADKPFTEIINNDDLSSFKTPAVQHKKTIKNREAVAVKTQKEDIQHNNLLTDAGNDVLDKKNSVPVNDKPTGPAKDNIPVSEIKTEADKTNIQDTVNKSVVENKNQEPESKKEKQKKKGSFMLTLSAGADVSAVGFDKIGTAAMQYGGGIGYNFSNGITLRTGFYAGKKLYSADSADYNPPAGWWRYYPGLKNIKADCKVYEIPLLVSYNFKRVKNHNWFVSTGISSVIMKRETYDYLYKGAWGQYQTTRRTIENKNKHLFSVLTLSGGYTYTLNKRIAFGAEPYYKMPLSGIGFGKIKLSSAGVLFSMSVKPFSKKK
jgi:cytoskeletal protein RodZ